MRILKPISITSYVTSVPETDYAEYNAGTPYAATDRVIVAVEHNVYQSLVSSNTGNTPSTSPESWALVGKTNAYKAIDAKVSTQTISATTMTFEFDALKSSSLAFLNVESTSITVQQFDGATEIFSETKSGISRVVTGWFDYFFADFTYRNSFVFDTIFNPNSTYIVTVTGVDVKVGVMLMGNLVDVGASLIGLENGYIDYSKKEFDQWGELYLAQGNFRDYLNSNIIIETYKLPTTLALFKTLRGTLNLFVPSADYDIAVYGFIQEPRLIYENSTKSIYTLDIQGII